ncbi:MAG: MBL fold metallo-hydrolase [Bacteroidales bacterium]
MVKVERLVFNAFQENTWLIYDDSGECVIIDPGCHGREEEAELDRFISENDLKPVAQVLTHCHIDHILGISYVHQKYDLDPLMHESSLATLRSAPEHAMLFGVDDVEVVIPEVFLREGDQVKFGNSALEVIYTPGHVDGHICLINHQNRMVIAGDVLFRDSIGRTDLPTGDYDILISHIRNKLFVLDDDYTVYPGHGPETTIGYEKRNNPFVRI